MFSNIKVITKKIRISLKILGPKKGIILGKIILELSSLFVHIPLFIVNLYFEIQVHVYMFSNGRYMTKCHSFCMTRQRV